MKLTVTIARLIVGLLFIFSGLIKAIDPLGLTYKMQEFFEVWRDDHYLPSLMTFLHNYSFSFSIIMITLEVALGVGLLVGWKKKLVLRLLLLLMLFFTFLTSYVLFSGKIRACGCFGDCVPLTPIQTFTKDIILLLLTIFLLIKQRYIEPVSDNLVPFSIVSLSVVAVLFLQLQVVKHLPSVDCLPYKPGNDLLKLREMPADAVPDKFEYDFIYEKNGEKKSFAMDKLPDSTWKFSERKQVLIQKGKNNVPLINDFSLTTMDGVDSTEAILNQPIEYYLFFVKDFAGGTDYWSEAFATLAKAANRQNRVIYVVTADPEKANNFFNTLNHYNVGIYSSDATAIKTAARANPTLFLMKGPVVQQKYSWADLDEVTR